MTRNYKINGKEFDVKIDTGVQLNVIMLNVMLDNVL